MVSHVRRSHSKLGAMLQQHQAEILARLETLLVSACAGSLAVADRLKLRRLVDGLCHASAVIDKPVASTNREMRRLKHLSGSRRTLSATPMQGMGSPANA